MSELPENWEWATLGTIADTQLGKMLSKKSKTGVRSRPYLRNINVQWHRIDLDDVPEMDFTEAESTKYDLVPGDLLVCEGGEVGRTATWRGGRADVHFQKALHRVRPLGGAEPKFLEYAMRWSADTDRFAPLVTGSTISHLPQQALRQVLIPVPPLPEQRRIVAAIEEHFSRLDAAEVGLRRSRALTTALNDSAFEALVDDDWPTAAIGEVAKVGSGSTPSRSESRYWEGGRIPWVSSAAVNRHRITEPSALITDDALAETSVKLWPPGTVLVAMYGEGKTRGKAAVLEIEATCNQACAAIVSSDDVEAEYLRMVLTSQYEQNRKLASGGVQPNLNLGLIREMRIPLPEVATQRQLVESAATFADLIERLNESVVQAERRSAALRRSILAAAFSGRLVSQDPADEPAARLLERIAVERAASKSPPKKKAAS